MLRPYKLKWMEEVLRSEELDAHAQLRQRLPGQTLATGEHWYTTPPFQHAASRFLVDILQPDINWVGGMTAIIKICAIAEVAGISVIAHGGGNTAYGQHACLALPAIPWTECFVATPPRGWRRPKMAGWCPPTPPASGSKSCGSSSSPSTTGADNNGDAIRSGCRGADAERGEDVHFTQADRFRQHGEQAKDQVWGGGEFYVRLWEESAGGSREEVLQLAGRFGPVIGGFDAAILVSTTLILPA